jgi:tetratricopeptide (TPR) repeat protein
MVRVFLVFVMTIGLVISYGLSTVKRNADYQTRVSIWADAVQKRPENARAFYNLGNAYHETGELDKAIDQYLSAIWLEPAYAEAHNNLGVVLDEQGKGTVSRYHYATALRLNPDYAEAHNNMGAVLFGEGKTDEAISHFLKALELRPGYPTAEVNLKMAREQTELSKKLSAEKSNSR